MDMTSMVDVTFLLVIFFMVTASFTLQSAFSTPQKRESAAGNQEQVPHAIEVYVDEFDQFSVFLDGAKTGVAANKYELRIELEMIVEKDSVNAMIVASPDAKHEKVMDALDVMVGLKLSVSVKLKG